MLIDTQDQQIKKKKNNCSRICKDSVPKEVITRSGEKNYM